MSKSQQFAHRVEPGTKVKLQDIQPRQDGGLEKEEGAAQLDELLKEIDLVQEELYAAGTHSLLIVFQGMDTAGKDGAIRGVLSPADPQGCHVTSFKVPTEEEREHDFLWRVHKAAPRQGMIGVFNRSHYEDVLVVRVHELVPEGVWKRRYEHINAFEELLADSNTIILKFFLHISREEQEQRLLEREKEPEKAWKLAVGDWKERLLWDDYQQAYEDALTECSTKTAPWYIIPSDRKWFRNLAVAQVLVEELEPYRKLWKEKLHGMSEAGRAELTAYREGLKAKGS